MFSCLFSHAPVVLPHEQKGAVVGRVAEIRWETGVLPCYFSSRGPTIGIRAGGEGKVPGADAHAGEVYWLPSSLLLLNV